MTELVTTSAAAEEMVDVPLESTDESKIGDRKISTSTTDVPVALKGGKGKKGGKDAEKEPPPPPRVTFRQLYTYATACDLIMVFLGAFNAIATGAAMPLMLVGFGKKLEHGWRVKVFWTLCV